MPPGQERVKASVCAFNAFPFDIEVYPMKERSEFAREASCARLF
jgi:hypothetical protein